MHQIICAKIGKRHLLINNKTYKSFEIPAKLYDLIENVIKNSDNISEDILNAIKIKLETKFNLTNESFFLKKADYNLHAASYEITDKCNFKCRHCMLDEKMNIELDLKKKKQIINFLNNMDCLWIQITGGEPLLSKDFEEIYMLIHSFGMLITVSTNGSMIYKYKNLLIEYPPYEIAISLYGATSETYKKTTGAKENYFNVLRSLEFFKKNKFRVKMNIILTKDNQNEISLMKKIAEEYKLNYHIYDKISPGLSGSYKPLLCNTEHKINNLIEEKASTKCYAGVKFFHINPEGKISICKIARKPNFDLFTINPLEIIKNLNLTSKKILRKPKYCIDCKNLNCGTCPPILNLYQKANCIPNYICERR